MIEYLHWHSLSALILLLAFILDFIIADPRWLPHPVVIIGHFINSFEVFLRGIARTSLSLRLAGVVLTVVTVMMTFTIALIIFKLLFALSNEGILWYYLSIGIFIYLTSTTLACKGLIDACSMVVNEIERDNLDGARHNLSMIVGRDTAGLSRDDVLKATIETLSENLSDAVVAPTFYYLLGGFPLAMTYKAVNTLDSMVGYKNDRYKDLGWASARLDDMANFIPARITAMMIVIATFFIKRKYISVRETLSTLIRDGHKHPSPNSGLPESAMAGAVGVRLGGPSYYGGVVFEKPYIGALRNDDYLASSKEALSIAKATILLSMFTFIGLLW